MVAVAAVCQGEASVERQGWAPGAAPPVAAEGATAAGGAGGVDAACCGADDW